MHKKGLETYKDLVKIFILQIIIGTSTYMSLCNHNLNDTLNYNLLFLANVLTNKFVISQFQFCSDRQPK